MNDNSKKKSTSKQTGLDASVHVEGRHQKVHHGNNIELYRTAKGYSQEYMATQLEIAQQRFSDLEKQEIVDEEILTKIAAILGLNTEWLRDIPAHRASNLYSQNGSGVYFANTGDVTHTIVKPVEEVVASYDKILKRVDAEIERLREELNEEKRRVDVERDKREQLIIKLSEPAMKKN